MWPIVGYERAVGLLRNSIASGRLAHAYLFIGPPHVGKLTLARAFAQALNCEQLGEPCGQCRSCRLIARDRHHDVQVIQAAADAEDGTGGQEDGRASRRAAASIGIGQVRAMQHDAALAPYEARYKVYIIRDADKLTVEAGNSLLKTLEEPPNHVILIVTATDAKMLLPTVVSRCQQIGLAPLPIPVARQALIDNWDLDRAEADRLARLSRGCLGWAINALANPKTLAKRRADLDRLIAVGRASRVERFGLAEKLAAEFTGNLAGLQNTLGLWSEWWRDVLLAKIGCIDLVTNIDLTDTAQETANGLTVEQICSFAREIETTVSNLEANSNVRLALESLVLAVPTSDAVGVSSRRH